MSEYFKKNDFVEIYKHETFKVRFLYLSSL